MIHLLALLCSFTIQFASVGITPFNYSGYYYDSSAMDYLSRLSGVDLLSIFHANYANDSAGVAYSVSPLNFFTSSSDDMIVTFNSYILDDNLNVIGYNVTYQNVRVHYWSSSGQLVYSDFSGSNIYYVTCYFNDHVPVGNSSVMRVVLLNEDYLPYILNNVVFVYDDVLPDDFDSLGLGFGSLSVNGHSSLGNPLEDLDSFSWSNFSPSFALTGHSVGVSQNQSTPDFTNPVQNLLGQIIDNTNSIISNIKGVGDYLGGIVSNVREGFSAIFNGLSQFNNNFITFGNYILEPLDQDVILDHIEDMSFYGLVSTVNTAASHISSSFNNISDNQSLIFPIDLRNTYFSNAGIMYLDLTFLDDSKSTWQPLLIAFLYITLAFNILMSLPSIIQGQSREGGKSD